MLSADDVAGTYPLLPPETPELGITTDCKLNRQAQAPTVRVQQITASVLIAAFSIDTCCTPMIRLIGFNLPPPF